MSSQRKSLIAKYKKKAKARGKNTSRVDTSKLTERGRKKKKNKAQNIQKRVPVLEMTVDNETYRKGDIAWYVLEAEQHSKKPCTGEILECHPNDKTAPSVSVWDQTTGCYRTIRASLIGWNKVEAKKKWNDHLEINKTFK